MRQSKRLLDLGMARMISFISFFFLMGCAAMLVPATRDPNKKLGYAGMLYEEQGRPLPAERLIREAIVEFERSGDEIGLAQAYWHYGTFFRSASIAKWEVVYRRDGFLDKSATFDNRYSKSIEKFQKAGEIFSKHQKYDALTNIYLNIGFSHEWNGDPKAACAAYDESLKWNRKNLETSPDAKVNLPDGVPTFEAFLAPHRKRANCP